MGDFLNRLRQIDPALVVECGHDGRHPRIVHGEEPRQSCYVEDWPDPNDPTFRRRQDDPACPGPRPNIPALVAIAEAAAVYCEGQWEKPKEFQTLRAALHPREENR